MLRYNQTREESAEILRLALSKMGQQEASFVPTCYAVWYEYIAGVNEPLVREVDRLVGLGQPLEDETIQQLYDKFVSECASDTVQVVRESAKKIFDELAQRTSEADSRAHLYEDHLGESEQRLSSVTDVTGLTDVLGYLQTETHDMRTSMQTLQKHLAASREEIRALEKQLEHAQSEALNDPLTGVLNRRGFDLRLKGFLENTQFLGSGLCLIMADIDFFKKVNDTYGHVFGDKVIRAVAQLLKTNVKGQDVVARIGGEEFAVLLPDTPLEGARVLAEKIRSTLEHAKIRRLDKKEDIGGTTISLGIALYIPGEEPADFIDRADKALYVSKEGGRNRTTVAG